MLRSSTLRFCAYVKSGAATATSSRVRLATATAAGAATVAVAVASCQQAFNESTSWDAEVDYIVIGAGSAGCAVAARLAERLPGASTLLVEAGWHDDLPQIQTAV